jgi:adenylate kinase family enzyme
MRKILVLGCSGAGKSTLARQISGITGLPIIHLDQHYWRPGWQEPDRATWERQVAALVHRPQWVMDGNYGGTLAARLAAADTAILLDFPTWRCFARVLRRIIGSLGRVRADMAPGCPERLDLAFLIYVYRYRRRDQHRHLAAIRQFGGTLVTLRRPAEVAAFVSALEARSVPITAPQCDPGSHDPGTAMKYGPIGHIVKGHY